MALDMSSEGDTCIYLSALGRNSLYVTVTTRDAPGANISPEV